MAPTYRLVVGAPDATRSTRTGTGAAYLLDGGDALAFPILERLYGAAKGDHLGMDVGCGQLNDGLIGDLVAVAPNADDMTDQDSGAAYVLFTRE
jgi:hypothetical protein